MTDDRDRPRKPHRDYASTRARTPARGVPVGPPLYGTTSGEMDSDDARMAEHFEDDTPVEVLKRIEAKLKPPTVEVDASAFDPDIRWQQFDAMRAEVSECRKERLTRAKWRKVIWGSGIVSGSTVIALLVWIATSLDARATAAAEERIRIHTLKRHVDLFDDFERWRAGVDAQLGILNAFILPRRIRQPGDSP